MDTFSLCLHNDYTTFHAALACNGKIISQTATDKINAASQAISLIEELLKKNSLALSDLCYIAANQGPGPFTTLRVVLTTVNGLSFATQLPLFGIDALYAMQQEYADTTIPTTIVLFNAFNNDVYFSIKHEEKIEAQGYDNIDSFLQKIKEKSYKSPIRFLGNGAELFREKIKKNLASSAMLPDPMTAYCSIEQIAYLAYEQYKAHEQGSHQLLPLYLKKHAAQIGKSIT